VLQGLLEWSIAAAAAAVVLMAAGVAFSALRFGGRRAGVSGDHDALAGSLFTIPVSVIVPIERGRDARAAAQRAAALLNLKYPEFEVIVVADASGDGALEGIKAAWELAPNEFFYRQALKTASVQRIYRSTRDTRLLLVEKEPAGRSDALNCGVNLARYRYATIVDLDVLFDPDALLRAMAAPLADPASVVAATCHVECGGPSQGWRGAFDYLASARALMESRVVWKGMANGVCPDAHVFVFRRDALLQLGGFSPRAADAGLDAMSRLQERTEDIDGAALPGVVRTSELFGRVDPAQPRPWSPIRRQRALLETLRTLAEGEQPSAALRYLTASRVIAPLAAGWFVAGTFAGAAAGRLPWHAVALAVVAVSFGQAAISTAALLLRGSAPGGPEGGQLTRLVLAAPFEAAVRGPVTAFARLAAIFTLARRRR